VITTVERLVAAALAETADEQLTELLDRARAEGRLGGLNLLMGWAVQAMRDGLGDLVDSWCRASGGTPDRHGHGHGHHGYVPSAGMRRLIQRRHTTCTFPTIIELSNSIHAGNSSSPGLLIWISPSGSWHIVTPQ
jgi:hypothetical protein